GVVEALARQVHRLAAGDALDDDRGVLVYEDRHQAVAIFATARPAASYIDTVRSQYSTPYLRRILKPSSSHAPGMRKMAIVSAGVGPHSAQALFTPRAPLAAPGVGGEFLITAVLFTPGVERLGVEEFGEPARFLDAGVAADLAVVGRPAAVLADGIEEGERATAGADHEPQVAVELAHVAGHAAVIRGVHLRALDLERGGRLCLARLLLADAELVEELRVLVACVAFQVDVAVEHQEAAVAELAEGIDLGERQVVAEEDLDQRRDDRDQAVEIVAGHADGGDRLLRTVGAPRENGREVHARHVLRVLLRHLLDVDAAHVAEDEDRQLPSPVPGDGREVLLRHRRALLDQHAARLLALDLELQDCLRRALGVGGRVGEFDAPGLHAAAGQDLRLDDDRGAHIR